MKRIILVTMAAALLTTGVAESHTLWKSKAERISWRAAKALCDDHADCEQYSIACARRSQHRVDCSLNLHWQEYLYDDPETLEEVYTEVSCSVEVAWYYRGHGQPRNHLTRFRVLYSDCELAA